MCQIFPVNTFLIIWNSNHQFNYKTTKAKKCVHKLYLFHAGLHMLMINTCKTNTNPFMRLINMYVTVKYYLMCRVLFEYMLYSVSPIHIIMTNSMCSWGWSGWYKWGGYKYDVMESMLQNFIIC